MSKFVYKGTPLVPVDGFTVKDYLLGVDENGQTDANAGLFSYATLSNEMVSYAKRKDPVRRSIGKVQDGDYLLGFRDGQLVVFDAPGTNLGVVTPEPDYEPTLNKPDDSIFTKIPHLTNEFLDGLKLHEWDDHDPKWTGRFPSWFEPNNLSVTNDQMLKMTCRMRNDSDTPPEVHEDYKEKFTGEYTHAACAYKSKTLVKYGFFETKSKTISGGWWNSFWLYRDVPEWWTEIDIYEIVGSEDYRFSTAHRFRELPDYIPNLELGHHKKQKEFFKVTDVMEWHVYAVDWSEETISWYVDGDLVFTTPNVYWHQPIHLMFDTEVHSWPGLPATGGDYMVEYVRSWKKSANPDTPTDPDPEPEDDFQPVIRRTESLFTKRPLLTNEFHNVLKRKYWDDHDPKDIGKSPAYRDPLNVYIENGSLKLAADLSNTDSTPGPAPGYDYACAAYKSKNIVKYGYFEIEAKASDSQYVNRFWLHDTTDTDDLFITICELAPTEEYRSSSAEVIKALPDYEGTPEDHFELKKEFFNQVDLTSDHVYGLDWDKDNITWYMDGLEVYTIPNTKWHNPMFIEIDTRVELWVGLPPAGKQVFSAGYLRVWSKSEYIEPDPLPEVTEQPVLAVTPAIPYIKRDIFTNEFHNVLKRDLWDRQDPDWVGGHPGYYDYQNLAIVNGSLQLANRNYDSEIDIRPAPYNGDPYLYTTGAYKSKGTVLYGYFEIEAKAMADKDINVFQLYAKDDVHHSVLNVCQMYHSERYRACSAEVYYDASIDYEQPTDVANRIKMLHEEFSIDDMTDYHVYGMDWTASDITWYVDGVEVFTTPNTNWNKPLHIMINTDVRDVWPGLPADGERVFDVKYVRTWKPQSV